MSTVGSDPGESVDEAPRFHEGSLVAWAGPAELTDQLHLTAGHPGEVRSPEPMAVTVRWIDVDGWFNHVGIFQQEWLEPISDATFEERSRALRTSGWPGFPAGEY